MKLVTHYDLDGAVCAILLKTFIKQLVVKAIGYNTINDVLDEYIMNEKCLIITDLSLDEYHVRNMLASNNNILWIDHHQSSLEHKNKSTDKVKIYINDKFCAAGNVLKFFKDKTFSDSLKRLAYLTNDYDLWQLKEEESQILNYIFWERKFNSFVDMFKNGYDDTKVNAFKPLFKKYKQNIQEYFEKCEQYDVTLHDKRFLLIYANKYINEITLNYPGFDFYFIVSDRLKISIRSKDDDLTPIFKSIESMTQINTIGGHKNAGGINLVDCFITNDEITDFYFELIEKIITGAINNARA